jgi:hypothetical protein
MGKVVEEISPDLERFIAEQMLFFVGTAPLSPAGHVNLSPKGLDTFRVLSPRQVAYLDLTGSGNETSAHLAENGRVTLMFCSFTERPLILRLYGRGRTVLPDDPRWGELLAPFPTLPGARQIMLVDVERVQTSCGFGVPAMKPARQRETLLKWAAAKSGDALRAYQAEKNAASIDGLPTPLGVALDRP